MSAERADNVEADAEQALPLLIACDEALAAGLAPDAAREASGWEESTGTATAELAGELEGCLALLERMERIWPRGSGKWREEGGMKEEGASARTGAGLRSRRWEARLFWRR